MECRVYFKRVELGNIVNFVGIYAFQQNELIQELLIEQSLCVRILLDAVNGKIKRTRCFIYKDTILICSHNIWISGIK